MPATGANPIHGLWAAAGSSLTTRRAEDRRIHDGRKQAASEKCGRSRPAALAQGEAGIGRHRRTLSKRRVLPQHLTRRFISLKEDAVVVTGRIPDIDASQLLPVIEKLDGALGAVRSKYPNYSISVTGLSAIAARNSANMIGALNDGLVVEMIFVAR